MQSQNGRCILLKVVLRVAVLHVELQSLRPFVVEVPQSANLHILHWVVEAGRIESPVAEADHVRTE